MHIYFLPYDTDNTNKTQSVEKMATENGSMDILIMICFPTTPLGCFTVTALILPSTRSEANTNLFSFIFFPDDLDWLL